MPRHADPGVPARSAALRLTLRQLQIFVAVARAGSTTAAARDVALSQSATSAALNELESLLGGQLFTRAGRRLVLNEQGRSMLPHARALVDAGHSIEEEFGAAGSAQAPRLRLAASTTIGNYVLPRLIAGYRRRERHAHIAVDIGNTQHAVEAVAALEVDLGLIEGPTTHPDLVVRPWIEDELVVVCSPRHALAGTRGKVPIARLRDHPWLLREPGSGTREVVEHALLPHLHTLRTDLELGSAEAIKRAVAEGLGITCLSRHAVAELVQLKRLVVLRTALPRLTRTFYVIQHQRRHPTPTLARFIAHCLA